MDSGICDLILERLESDRERDTVDVRVVFSRPLDDAADDAYDTQYSFSFVPVYACERRISADNFVLSMSGIHYRPSRDVVKTFVSSWVDAVSDTSRARTKVSCEVSATAARGGGRIYGSKVRFDCGRSSVRRAVNRVVETVMRIKGLVSAMAA